MPEIAFVVVSYFVVAFQMKVTIWARVQFADGLKVVLDVPLVIFSFTAHSTASK